MCSNIDTEDLDDVASVLKEETGSSCFPLGKMQFAAQTRISNAAKEKVHIGDYEARPVYAYAMLNPEPGSRGIHTMRVKYWREASDTTAQESRHSLQVPHDDIFKMNLIEPFSVMEELEISGRTNIWRLDAFIKACFAVRSSTDHVPELDLGPDFIKTLRHAIRTIHCRTEWFKAHSCGDFNWTKGRCPEGLSRGHSIFSRPGMSRSSSALSIASDISSSQEISEGEIQPTVRRVSRFPTRVRLPSTDEEESETEVSTGCDYAPSVSTDSDGSTSKESGYSENPSYQASQNFENEQEHKASLIVILKVSSQSERRGIRDNTNNNATTTARAVLDGENTSGTTPNLVLESLSSPQGSSDRKENSDVSGTRTGHAGSMPQPISKHTAPSVGTTQCPSANQTLESGEPTDQGSSSGPCQDPTNYTTTLSREEFRASIRAIQRDQEKANATMTAIEVQDNIISQRVIETLQRAEELKRYIVELNERKVSNKRKREKCQEEKESLKKRKTDLMSQVPSEELFEYVRTALDVVEDS